MKEIPDASFWKQEFKKLGYDIVFRYLSGESQSLQKLGSDYDGYFFQLENRININNQGIFIRHCSIKNQIVSMAFEQHDPDLELLWTALTSILANIPDVKISCGNCNFTGAEWMHELTKL